MASNHVRPHQNSRRKSPKANGECVGFFEGTPVGLGVGTPDGCQEEKEIIFERLLDQK